MASQRQVKVIMHDPYVDWYRFPVGGGPGPVIHGRGYALVDGKYYEGQQLVDAVGAKCTSIPNVADVLKALIPTLDGCWALAAHWPDGRVLAATDRVRSIPMFYALTPDKFVLASDIEDVRGRCDLDEVDDEAAREYLFWGYVTGDETLFRHVKQMRCADLLEYKIEGGASSLEVTQYFHYFPREYSDASEEELEDELESILNSMFSNFLAGHDGSRIVVPLSGGLDSRLVCAMLKKNGFDDVLCYSYGCRENEQSRISRRVADALGFEWRFIEYTGETWNRWMQSREMAEYWQYGAKGVSPPHIAGFPATIALRDAGVLAEGAVFFPGHSLDFPAGSQVPAAWREIQSGTVSKVDEIIRFHALWPSKWLPPTKQLRDKIDRLSAAPFGGPDCSPMASWDMWNIENRQALFIVNSVRAYEFVGARWRTLWDYPLMEFFFQKLPLRYRLGRRLHATVLQERVFTGAAKALAVLPIPEIGAWRGRDGLNKGGSIPVRRRSALRAAVGKALNLVGLAETLRNMLAPRRADALCTETWFARGRDPKCITVAEAMQPFETLRKLPTVAKPLLKHILGRRVDLVGAWELFLLFVLGEICAEAPLPSRRTKS